MLAQFLGKHDDSKACSIEEEIENHGFSDFFALLIARIEEPFAYLLLNRLFIYRSVIKSPLYFEINVLWISSSTTLLNVQIGRPDQNKDHGYDQTATFVQPNWQ